MKSGFLVVLICVGLSRADDVALAIDEVFGNVDETEGTIVHCECVPFYQCDEKDIIKTAGEGLIDVRFGEDNQRICENEVEVCCKLEYKEEKKQTKEEEFTCGKRNYEGVFNRILSDTENEAYLSEFPWMVALVRRERRRNGSIAYAYKCGGSLIHPRVVLTAAHCIYRKNLGLFKVIAGDWDLSRNDEALPSQERSLVRVIIHNEFYRRGLLNDIALLVINEPFKLAPHIDIICLPGQDALVSDSNCLATGWGRDAFDHKVGKLQKIMKKVELPLVPTFKCNNVLREHPSLGRTFQLHESFICAGGEPGRDTCQGDGGSPLVCSIPGTDRYQQVGIVAWGIGCGTHYPGVYVNVALFRYWIDQNMAELNLTPKYTLTSNSTSP